MARLIKAALAMAAALLPAAALSASVPEGIKAEVQEYTRWLEADGAVIDWDQAVVLSLHVQGKPATTLTLPAQLERDGGVMISFQYIKVAEDPPLLIIGLTLNPEALKDQKGELRMVMWMSQTGRFTPMTMRLGGAQPVPEVDADEREAREIFARYLPKTYAFITERFPPQTGP